MEKGEEKIVAKRPEAILFDLGGTLLHDRISGDLGGRMRSRLERRAFVPFVGEDLNLPQALADAMDAVCRDGLKEFHVKKWLEDHLPAGSDLEGSEGSPKNLERFIRSKIIDYAPPEDARRVLRELHDLKLPMGVVSNSIFSSDLLLSDIRELSLVEAFRFVVSSAELGLRKPHPAIFRDAVEKLGANPAETWYVGDLWENDVVGSSRAGLIPVWLNANTTQPPSNIPHLRAGNWTELGKLLGL